MSRLALNAPVLPWAIVLVIGIVVWDAWFRQKQPVAWPEGEHTYEAVVISEPVAKPKTIAVDVLLLSTRQKIKCYIHTDERSSALTVGDGIVFSGRVQ